MLALLGIEVWVRRGQSTPEPETLAPAPAPAAESRAEPGAALAPPNPPDSPAAGFTLELLGLGCAGALVIGELPLAEDRRIARDVLAAVCGTSGEEPARTPFHWPQSSRGEQGREAASNALQAFIRGQVERAEVRVIVLFGDATRQLLLPDLDVGDQLVQFAGAQCVLTGSTAQLRISAERKRSLWQCILTIPAPL